MLSGTKKCEVLYRLPPQMEAGNFKGDAMDQSQFHPQPIFGTPTMVRKKSEQEIIEETKKLETQLDVLSRSMFYSDIGIDMARTLASTSRLMRAWVNQRSNGHGKLL